MNTLSSGYRRWIWEWWKHYLSPSTYYYYVKYKWQRAQRGWADCDTWGLDNYLSDWLPDALRYLKEHKHGTPCAMFEKGELETVQPDGFCWAGKEADERASAKWNGVMDQMIVGFEAFNRMQEGLYEDELGPYPLREDWLETINDPRTKEEDERFNKSRELEKRDEQLFKEGAALFIEYFSSLWD